jgi:hypothetical protein
MVTCRKQSAVNLLFVGAFTFVSRGGGLVDEVRCWVMVKSCL